MGSGGDFGEFDSGECARQGGSEILVTLDRAGDERGKINREQRESFRPADRCAAAGDVDEVMHKFKREKTESEWRRVR